MIEAKPLICQEFVELITDYLDNALSPSDLVRFNEHVAHCPPCRLYLDQVRLTILAVGNSDLDILAVADRQQLVSIFRGWLAEQESK